MNNFLLILFLGLFGSTMAQVDERAMTAAEVKGFQTDVLEASSSTETIRCEFTQYKHMDFLTEDITSSGNMAYKSPDVVRWAYDSPYQYSVVFLDGLMKINDGGKRSEMDISSSDLFMKLNELMTKSVRGDLFTDPEFTVEYRTSPKYDKVIMTPKSEKLGGYLAAFELLFDKEDSSINEVKMSEPNSDYTRIVFSNRQLNPVLDDAVFIN